MAQEYSYKLTELIKEFELTVDYMPQTQEPILVVSSEVNRPGLALSGFFQFFDCNRLQIVGKAENEFLSQLDPEKRLISLNKLMEHHPVAVVFAHGNPVYKEAMIAAEQHGVPLLSTKEPTSSFMAAVISSLNVKLAQRITRHGVFVEVYGEGILLLGDSGVGKSETAIELIKRGHRLIADDAVEIKKVSSRTLVGSAPELIRHYIELRGIGIVDVRRLFGMGSVKVTEKIDLIISLEPWENGKNYDRFGLDTEYTDIMGIRVPSITVPVKPGRNLAIIIEVAAMNNRQKKMGYNTAEEFNRKLMEKMASAEDVN